MGASALRDRFRFDDDTGTTDLTAGTHAETATALCTRAGAFLPPADARFATLRARYSGAQFGLELRSDPVSRTIPAGCTATHVATGRVFTVLGAVDPDLRRRWLHIALQELNVPPVVRA